MVIIINLFKRQGSRLQEILHFNRYFSEDKIHGEISYHRLAQNGPRQERFGAAEVVSSRSTTCTRGRIADANCRLWVCDVIKSQIMGPHRLQLGNAGGGRETRNLFGVA